MPSSKIREPERLDNPDGVAVVTAIGRMVSAHPNKEAVAYTIARAAVGALAYYFGPKRAAMLTYQLADEMSDATGTDHGAR